ncbi:hypothetical protein [Proteus phage PM2]|uniref:dihydrofolate reductase n=1 Tax=Proteus phage PM2 TaxID=2025809 RepID=A0A249XYD7_9CAUD|nr:hypothetical protein KNT71_gp136 [Proteus phage PM2]ASZ76496.1 hypothetical protein [Proteus phage PM2]
MIQTIFATQKEPKGYGIGLKGGLPWDRIKQDMDNFKSRTIAPRVNPATDVGSYIVMGPKTFMAMPKLKDRYSIVMVDDPREPLLSLDGKSADREIIGPWDSNKLKEVCKELEMFTRNPELKNLVSIIGGKRLIEASFDFCDKVIWTEIKKSCIYQSDVFVDLDKLRNFKKIEQHIYMLNRHDCIEENHLIRDQK